jgi:hypothetical protein
MYLVVIYQVSDFKDYIDDSENNFIQKRHHIKHTHARTHAHTHTHYQEKCTTMAAMGPCPARCVADLISSHLISYQKTKIIMFTNQRTGFIFSCPLRIHLTHSLTHPLTSTRTEKYKTAYLPTYLPF